MRRDATDATDAGYRGPDAFTRTEALKLLIIGRQAVDVRIVVDAPSVFVAI